MPSAATATDHLAQARQFLERVLPWPRPGEPTAFIGIHWTRKGGSDDKPIWSSRACSTIDEAINAIQFALRDPNTRDLYVAMSSQCEYEERISQTGFTYKVAKRSRQNAVALKSLFLDIDVGKAVATRRR
jgi:hypothetical protein